MTERSTLISIGEGFALRSLCATDADAIARYANNRNVWRNLRDVFPTPYDREHAVKFIKEMLASEPEGAFAIASPEEAIGVIGFHLQPDVLCRTAEVGYWLGEPFWGRGIATRALIAITGYAFQRHDYLRLTSNVFGWNLASARVLEKAGYTREGVLRNAVFKDGQVTDLLIYGKLR